MFAVIRTGGKQYKVAKNEVIRIERIEGNVGDTVSLDEVLAVGGDGARTVGSPLVDGASVAAEVLDQRKDKKVLVFKKKRRHNYRRLKGHRQEITVLRVTDILTGGKKAATAKKAEPKAEAKAPAADKSAETPAAESEAAPKAEAETEAKKAPAKKPAARKPAAKKAPAKKAAAPKSAAKKPAAKKPAGGKSKSASNKSTSKKSEE